MTELQKYQTDLCCGDEGSAHENRECGETDGIVLFVSLRAAAGVLAKRRAVVQGDAHKEHRQTPAQRAEHTLVTVSIP